MTADADNKLASVKRQQVFEQSTREFGKTVGKLLGTGPGKVQTACWVVENGSMTGSPLVADLQAAKCCPRLQLTP